MTAPILLLCVFLLYMLSVALLRRFALPGLMCTRAFSKPAYFEGDEGEMIEVVRNDRPFIIPWLRVESGVSPYIRFGRQENLNISDTAHTSSLFTLMPYQQIRRRHHVRFLRRGAYDLGRASLTAGDLLGLAEINREQDMHVPVLVYPRLLDPRDLPAPLFRMVSEMPSSSSLLDDPFLVRGIRPYQIGDPVRDIHWPATARTGEAHVRLHDRSAQSRLLILMNVQQSADQWGDVLMEYEQGDAEYAISMAATLCMHALDTGAAAGFSANMPLTGETDCVFLPPENGEVARERLLAAFARLKIVRALRFETFLARLPAMCGVHILVLSRYDSEEIQSALAQLRRMGNHTSLYLMKGGENA